MKKAEVDAGGRFASAIAYQPEYSQLRGQLDQVRKSAAEKNCNLSGGRQWGEWPASQTTDFRKSATGG